MLNPTKQTSKENLFLLNVHVATFGMLVQLVAPGGGGDGHPVLRRRVLVQVVTTVLLGGRDDVSPPRPRPRPRGGGGGEQGGGGDHADLGHADALAAVRHVAVVALVAAGGDALVGVDGQGVDCLVH